MADKQTERLTPNKNIQIGSHTYRHIRTCRHIIEGQPDRHTISKTGRDRQRQRLTYRQTDKLTDRRPYRQTHIHTDRGRHVDRHSHTDRETDRQEDIQTDMQTYRQTNIYTDTGRQAHRQTARETDGMIYTYRQTIKQIYTAKDR